MKRRNIAVFFDGTGQDMKVLPRYLWSNVAFLYEAVDTTETPEVVQSRKYLDGVGTRKGEDLTGGGFGIGLDERIEEACDFLYQEFAQSAEHDEEPHVYLFGFSRGAFAARWLASLVDFCGVSKGNPAPRKLFVTHREKRMDDAQEFIDSGRVYYPVKIDFIGVWDTVEASIDKITGIANVPKCVGKVYHALAIDEWREKFKPTRFNPSEKVDEVWFPGCHTDVGGGYEIRTLANAPLWWIVSGCRKFKLRILEEALESTLERLKECAAFHDELAHSLLWQTLNGGEKYFREIRDGDWYDTSTVAFSKDAPADRPTIPSSCIAKNFGGGEGVVLV